MKTSIRMKTPITDSVQFVIGSKTPLDDAFKCFESLREVSRHLEIELTGCDAAWRRERQNVRDLKRKKKKS